MEEQCSWLARTATRKDHHCVIQDVGLHDTHDATNNAGAAQSSRSAICPHSALVRVQPIKSPCRVLVMTPEPNQRKAKSLMLVGLELFLPHTCNLGRLRANLLQLLTYNVPQHVLATDPGPKR